MTASPRDATTDPLVLALDFGGSKLAAALYRQEVWLALERAASRPGATAHDDLELMTRLAVLALRGGTPDVIAISFGGPVFPETGTVRLSHHVPGWENFPLAEYFAAQFNRPCVLENDGHAGALGEQRYGAGPPEPDLPHPEHRRGRGPHPRWPHLARRNQHGGSLGSRQRGA